MDKKSLLAIAICFVILLFYPLFVQWISPKSPAPPPSLHSQAPENKLDKRIEVPATAEMTTKSESGEIIPVYSESEEVFSVENGQIMAIMSSWSGVIRDFGLKYFHDKGGHMLQLGAGAGQGWESFQLMGESSSMVGGAYKGVISGKTVVFESQRSDPLAVRKSYSFAEEGYEVHVDLQIENRSGKDFSFDQGLQIAVGSIWLREAKETLADVSAAALDSLGNVWRKGAGKIKASTSESGSFQWVGLQNQYYALILKAQSECQGLVVAPLFNGSSKVQGVQAAIQLGKFKIPPGESFRQSFVLYAGPKSYFQLKKMPYDFYKIIDFGMFSPISKGILYLLHYSYRPFRNYGIAIILLTVLVKIITYPLTAQSFRSMKRMQALQPHISALKDRHKENPKKMQKEMMELYKEHKVNPMGGCLPMLIQLPIFVALFNTLRSAIELKGSSFLWIKDLSLPDTVAVVAGLPINILPLVMGGTMVWQQKMSTVDPAQSKMMMLMPVFFTFIFYSFPSGLVLYWLVNNVLSILQQYQVQRQKT